MESEPGRIPSGRTGTGTQEESGTVLCQRWHFQAGTAGRGVQAGDRSDSKQILTLQVTPIHSPVFPALPGHKETLPHLATAWPCLQPQEKGSTDFWLGSGREGQPHSLPGWTGRNQVWVWINLPLSQTVPRAHGIPEPVEGNGNQPKGKNPTAAQLWA